MDVPISVSVATPADEPGITRVLEAAYGTLLKGGYDDAILAIAVPLMSRANPKLIASGTYYVARDGDEIVGCGGWTWVRPDAPDDPIDPTLGHVRHFASDPTRLRRGIGRALMERCVADAQEKGVERFEAYATLVAERFYQSLGFETVEPITVPFVHGVDFPSLRMTRRLTAEPD